MERDRTGELAPFPYGTILCYVRWVARKGQPAKWLTTPATEGLARRLARESGITEAEAHELIALLGPHNWSSLVREARILMKR